MDWSASIKSEDTNLQEGSNKYIYPMPKENVSLLCQGEWDSH